MSDKNQRTRTRTRPDQGKEKDQARSEGDERERRAKERDNDTYIIKPAQQSSTPFILLFVILHNQKIINFWLYADHFQKEREKNSESQLVISHYHLQYNKAKLGANQSLYPSKLN
ncbi:hypothetical protein Dimus_006876 [Dionaea muscipula]